MKQQYDSYKPSGIDWIGDIPSHWEICKIKHTADVVLGKMLLNEPPKEHRDIYSKEKYLKSRNIGWLNLLLDEVEEMWFNEYEKSLYKLNDGDVLVNEGGDIGKVAIWHDREDSYYIQNSVHKISPIGVNSEFLAYWIFTLSKRNYFWSIVSQVSIAHLTKEKLSNAPLIVPPLPEQQAIADYLDKKCAEINTAIAKVDREIELIDELKQSEISRVVTRGLNPDAPLRPSGIDWIGDIPSHWSASKIKFIGEIRGRIGFRGYTTADLVSEGEGALTIGGKHISNNVINLTEPEYISWDKYFESPEIMISKGDIVMAQRGTLKRAALITEDIGPATINPSLVLLTNIKVNSKYLHAYLCSSATTQFVDYLNTATAVPMISQNQIENIRLLLPPLPEQDAIAAWLDEKCAEIDGLKAKLSKKRETLTELRQSIISEVVTGKRKVI